MLDLSKACGAAWPSIEDLKMPEWYRVLGGGPCALNGALRELKQFFFVDNLTTTEGVYLRWCVQHCLEMYSRIGDMVRNGEISRSNQINPIQEAALMWIHDLYAPDIYVTGLAETYIQGLHCGERGRLYLDFLKLLEITRAKSENC